MTFLEQFGAINDVGLGVRWDAVSFKSQVDRRAVLLSKIGISRGSKVAILHGGTACLFADLFAAWMVGATAICLDPSLTDTELKIVTAFAQPALLLIRRNKPQIKLAMPIMDLDQDAASTGGSTVVPSFNPDDPALVLFTSGTTGDPKGVILSFRALSARIAANVASIGRATLRRTLVTLPTHFGHGLIGNALTPLMNGGEIVLHPLGAPLASNLGRIIDDYAISFMSSVPTSWRIAKTRSEPPKDSSLARVHVGSAPLSAQLWSDIAAWSRSEVINCYGLTETANWVAGASSNMEGIADGLVGKGWGCDVAIMDEGGSIRSAGRGELVIKSPSLMSGYLNRPDLTQSALRDGWFLTGDRGSVDENGRIWFTGRIKDEINRAGFKVQPAEIDLLLERHPSVMEACTVSVADPIAGEIVAAAVRLTPNAKVSAESLYAWCRERLRRAAIPERWIFLDEIPRNIRGKVNRALVRRMFDSGATGLASPSHYPLDIAAKSTCFQAAREDEVTTQHVVRHAVERAWVEVLDRRTFAKDISWNDSGGDSLNVLRFWFRIEDLLGKQLPLDSIDPINSTPSKIIAAIRQIISVSHRSLGPDGSPLVFWLSPAEGDLPEIARFRSAFGNQIRFVVIGYPSWREMLDAEGRFDAIVATAEAQIRAQCQDRVCFLAGYSFGGFVAWETAARLTRSGMKIGFVGLIDTRRRGSLAVDRQRVRPRIQRKLLVRIRKLTPKTVIRRLLTFLVKVKAFWLLRALGILASKIHSESAFFLQWTLVTQLRMRALRDHELGSHPTAVTLFRSEEFTEELPDYGWSTICSKVTVVPVSGSHSSLLLQADMLRSRFLEALTKARGACEQQVELEPSDQLA
jgi:oxalate---CoA ligase